MRLALIGLLLVTAGLIVASFALAQ